jgi:hypothetical protein
MPSFCLSQHWNANGVYSEQVFFAARDKYAAAAQAKTTNPTVCWLLFGLIIAIIYSTYIVLSYSGAERSS